MKYKFNLKANMTAAIAMVTLLLINCGVWLYFKQYIGFIMFLIITLIIIHMYLQTVYELSNDSFIMHLGLLNIKIKYSKIEDAVVIGQKAILKTKTFNIDIYPLDIDKFIKEIKSRIKADK